MSLLFWSIEEKVFSITICLRIGFLVQHHETSEVMWKSNHKIYTSNPFRHNWLKDFLELYLKIFQHFPTYVSHLDGVIYHAATLYWGVYPITPNVGYLLKTHYDQGITFGPAIPQPDGAFSVHFLLVLVPFGERLQPEICILINPLKLD